MDMAHLIFNISYTSERWVIGDPLIWADKINTDAAENYPSDLPMEKFLFF